MLLQDIFNSQYDKETEIYGLTVNEKSFDLEFSTPPLHFEKIGFILTLNEDKMIEENLLDLIISYKLTNIDVFLEVPSHYISQNIVNIKYLLQLSTNVNLSLSLLPPKHEQVNYLLSEQDYINVVNVFTQEMLKKQNYEKFLAPVTNLMEYTMLECLLGKDNVVVQNYHPTNFYISQNFNFIFLPENPEFKYNIKKELHALYGGQENFEYVASLIFKGVHDKSQELFTHHVEEYIKSHP